MLRRSLFALIFTGVLATPALAERIRLLGPDIEKAVAGKTVYLKVPLMGWFPLEYDKSGGLTGDGTSFTLLARFYQPTDKGRWWVENDKLCQQFEVWYKGRVACYTITDYDGSNFRWRRDDGRKGKGRTE